MRSAPALPTCSSTSMARRDRHLLIHPDGNGRVYVIDRDSGEMLSARPSCPTNATKGVDLADRHADPRGQQSGQRQHHHARHLPRMAGATGPGTAAYAPADEAAVHPGQPHLHGHGGAQHDLHARHAYMGANLRMKAARPEPRRRDSLGHRRREAGLDRGGGAFPSPAASWRLPAGSCFTARWTARLKRSTPARDGRSGSYQAPSGSSATPATFQGADGRQYIAVLSGIGGVGRVGWKGIDVRDATAEHGYANALRDVPVADRARRRAAAIRTAMIRVLLVADTRARRPANERPASCAPTHRCRTRSTRSA